MRGRVVTMWILMTLVGAAAVAAQTGPCGRTLVVVTPADKAQEERFLPAPPQHVKDSIVRALPAVGAQLKKADGLKMEGASQQGLMQAWGTTNSAAGAGGRLRAGTVLGNWNIELRPETRDGVDGTNVRIVFKKPAVLGAAGNSSRGATQLMEEVDCLSRLLSRTDPSVEPRGGVGAPAASESRAVVLPEGTPLRLVLRERLFSGDFKGKKGDTPTQVVFEVADRVEIDGVVVIRKGALGVGHITQAKAAGHGGKGAAMVFEFDEVTAADGQTVGITGLTERREGVSFVVRTPELPPPTGWADVVGAGAAVGTSLIVQAFFKGTEVVIRAGTTFEVETRGRPAIRVDK
jgi:hypothetical protein